MLRRVGRWLTGTSVEFERAAAIVARRTAHRSLEARFARVARDMAAAYAISFGQAAYQLRAALAQLGVNFPRGDDR